MKGNQIEVTQHFRPEEEKFIQQASDWIRQSEDEYRGILTRFLNPREQYILQTCVNRAKDLVIQFNGVVPHAESQRAFIAPSFYEIELSDFELALLEIKYPVKFTELHHATILGSFMSAGIERAVIGDILSHQDQWQIVVDAKMVTYIQQTVEKIGRVRITLMEQSLDYIPVTDHDDWDEVFLLLSSLRIDTAVSAAFDISRRMAKSLVEQEQVRINWATMLKPDHVIAVGDMVSVRHYGRLQLVMIDGLTKKDKIKTVVNIIRR